MNRRASLVAGVRDCLPLLVGIIPFGLVAGAAVVAAGLPAVLAPVLSVVVFAGASQLAAIELLGRDAAAVVVVGTVLVINLRMVMYSASLAPYVERVGLAARAPLAYILTDQAFAMAINRFETSDVDRPWYYVGVAVPLWVVWQICTVAGVFVGARLPESIPLEFAVPMTFLALLVPVLKGRATTTAALVGGIIALALVTLPFNLGLVVGSICGIAGGVLAERRFGLDEVADA